MPPPDKKGGWPHRRGKRQAEQSVLDAQDKRRVTPPAGNRGEARDAQPGGGPTPSDPHTAGTPQPSSLSAVIAAFTGTRTNP
jgi:hypothetical protein